MAILEKSARDVANDIAIARGRPPDSWGTAVFLLGAGCSVSAGIDTAGSIAKRLLIETANLQARGGPAIDDSAIALNWLKDNKRLADNVTMDTAYGALFSEIYRDPSQQRRIIHEAMPRNRVRLNWAHLCLGELVKEGYVSTVLTTNFDQLALEGMILAGTIPVVADGLESLNRIQGRPPHPQLIHLHGTLHTYNPRNTAAEIDEISNDAQAIRAVTSLLGDATVLVVVGYSGNDAGLMRIVTQAASGFPNKVIYWLEYSDDLTNLSGHARAFLEKSRNAAVVLKQDADQFFHELMRDLGIGAPHWMREPVAGLRMVANRLARPSTKSAVAGILDVFHRELTDLAAYLEDARSSQPPQARAIDKAREFQVAGRFRAAFNALSEAKNLPADEWVKLGDSARAARESLAAGEPVDVAIAAYEQARDLLKPLAQNSSEQEADLANVLNLLSLVIWEARRTGALKESREAVAIYRRLAQAEPTRFERRLVSSLVNMANGLRESGDGGGALTAIREAAEIGRRIAQTDISFEPELATCVNNLSNLLSSSSLKNSEI